MSIGLPVYNGGTYLDAALDSLLAQDFADFELIISDNASTDRTAEICDDYARRDARIRVVRNASNVGSPANFNQVFELATAPYFMWAADDDLWEPGYVRLCLAALQASPDAVLACTSLRFIDPDGRQIDIDYSHLDNPELTSHSPSRRLQGLLRRWGWYQMYGLMRADALRRTRLLRNIYGADVALTVELALLGPFVKVPDTAFWYRQFPSKTEADRAARQGYDGLGSSASRFTGTQLQEGISGAIMASRLPRLTKAALVAQVYMTTSVIDPVWRNRVYPELRPRLTRSLRERRFRVAAKCLVLAGVIRSIRLGTGVKRGAGRLARRVIGRQPS